MSYNDKDMEMGLEEIRTSSPFELDDESVPSSIQSFLDYSPGGGQTTTQLNKQEEESRDLLKLQRNYRY